MFQTILSKVGSILPQKGEKHFVFSIAIWTLTVLLLLGLVLLFGYISLFATPSFEELENPKYDLASFIFDDKDKVIGKYFVENREQVAFDSLNKQLVNSVIAEEDERFFDHTGIDYIALWRVGFKTLILGQKQSGGGSTLSQQLAKLLYKRPEIRNLNSFKSKTTLIFTKLKEWVTAVKLEHNYTKEEIIAIYLNKFEFVNGAHGIQSASKIYFNKTQDKLLPQEIALLVGMLQNPSLYNPIRFKSRAKKRRDEVLTKMQSRNIIDKLAYDTLISKEINVSDFRRETPIEGPAPYFRNEVTKMIRELFNDNGIKKPDGTPYNIYLDGLKIYTTIDLEYQALAEEAMKDHVSWLQNRYWNVWKGKDPITYKADKAAQLQREIAFTKHIKASDRYIALRQQQMAILDDIDPAISTSDYDIERLIALEKQSKNLDQIITSLGLSSDTAQVYTVFLKSDIWTKVKKAYAIHQDSFNTMFNTKVEMTVFDHKQGRKQAIMSPKDSVMYHLQHLQGGLLALDPKSGYVKAWVGGLDYDYFKFDHCTAYRQIGSTIKPFVYATAMDELGIKACDYFTDMPYTIKPGEAKFDVAEEWKPDNSTENFTYNPYNLYHGLLYSKNSITVRLMKELGDAQPLRNMMQRCGMDIDKKLYNGQIAVPNVPSICLGAMEATLFDMVGAYTVFVNDGIYSKPQIIKRIEDRNGRVIYNGFSPKRNAIDPLVCSTVLDMLQNNCQKDFKFNFKSKAGGKTGTTNDYIDGWFLGITPELVVGTWSGGEERFIRFTTLDDGQGYVTARPLFEKYIQKLEKSCKSYNVKANFPAPHPDLKKTTNCSHRKVIYPAAERKLRKMAEENPAKRDSINAILRVN